MKIRTEFFSFRNRVVVIVVGVTLGALSLLYTNDMARRLKEKEQHDVALWAHAMERVTRDVLGGSSLSSPVTVMASAPCEVLLVPYEKLLLPGADPARQRVLQNLGRTISDKYFLLSRRVDLLVLKSLRAKVCAYLLNESERAGSLTFSIPFSRVQLADYLNCDRSALSRELSLMQKDGLLDTFKSSFKLLDPDALKQMVQ